MFERTLAVDGACSELATLLERDEVPAGVEAGCTSRSTWCHASPGSGVSPWLLHAGAARRARAMYTVRSSRARPAPASNRHEHGSDLAKARETKAPPWALLDNTNVVVFIKNLESRDVLVNKRLDDDTGRPREQMIGTNDYEQLSPEIAVRMRARSSNIDYGGAIEVGSIPGEGTRVRLAPPNTGEPAGGRSRSAGAPRDTSKPSRRAVLLVDDEPVVRKTVALMLESLGFEVILAEDGRAAVERYAEHHADLDLVLLDMIMPNMGGDAAYRAMRDIDASVPVVVCSGYAADEAVRSMQAQGLAGFLAKPYRRAELAAIIEQTLGG